MAPYVCHVVPPYLLEAIAENDDPQISQLGVSALALGKTIHQHRRDFFAAKLTGGIQPETATGDTAATGIVPDDLLEHVAKAGHVGEGSQGSARQTLAFSKQIRAERLAESQKALADTPSAAADNETSTFTRRVYDMTGRGGGNINAAFNLLPGKRVRFEGEPKSTDTAVNEVYDNDLLVLEFYKKIFGYESVDGQNMTIINSVHFGQKYMNAAWLSTGQMIYGDGADFLRNFTGCIDVIGHELTVSSDSPPHL